MRAEKWPFQDEQSGAQILPGQYYGFGDAGGLAGRFSGYPTRAEAVRDIQKDHDCVIGLNPEDLGSEAITVLSGLQYVDRLRFICSESSNDMLPENINKIDISLYGNWTE